MSRHRKPHGRAKSAVVLAGWGGLFWMAFCVAPYLYALNDLIQWR
jgi:hypothetical protein